MNILLLQPGLIADSEVKQGATSGGSVLC